MWRHKVSFIGLLVAHLASGQDVIVTGAGDTLHCKITLVREDRIFFSLREDGRKSNEKISKLEITYYHQQGFAPVHMGPPVERVPYSKDPPSQKEKTPVVDPVRIALNAGWTHRTAPIPDDLPPAWIEYYEGLLSGYHYGADVSLFFHQNLGVTLMFDNARWHNEAAALRYNDSDGGIYELTTSDDISVGILGPALTWRWLSADRQWRALVHFGAGYTWYRDEMGIADLTLRVRGEDLYIRGEVDGEFMFSDHVGLGLSVDYIQSTLSKLEVQTGNTTIPVSSGTKEGLQRIGLSGGIRFMF